MEFVSTTGRFGVATGESTTLCRTLAFDGQKAGAKAEASRPRENAV
jgi:hypothetical protein